jgi:hypothetical protein
MQLAYDSDKRWELIHTSIKDDSFIILDNLAKKRRVYHVPQLRHVELVQQKVYVYTATEKIMQLDLLTATRQFLSPTQFDKVIQANIALQIKKRAAKKAKQAFANIVNLANPKFAAAGFLDTMSA